MPLTLIEPPEAEPVTLDEAKAFARVEDKDGRAFRNSNLRRACADALSATG